jgi:pimeloyl-ACP methyl ester carboxylesterase
MQHPQIKSGFINVGQAQIYYESAGQGTPFVMIHAGVADSRQWNNEFEYFAKGYQVIRYDMRGYGKSEPVEGEFSLMSDLEAVLAALNINEPAIIMGCSMGGGLAMDFALTHPSQVKALIMVGSGPSGLELDLPDPTKFADVEKAYDAGDLDLAAELEIQIWFDGMDRTPGEVDQEMRKLAYEMNRNALDHEAKGLGKRMPNTESPAFDRLTDLNVPVLVIVGAHDTPYILAASEYMIEKIPKVKKAVIKVGAHLPNMDQPDEFQKIVGSFLNELSH